MFRFVREVVDLFVEACRSSPDHGSKKKPLYRALPHDTGVNVVRFMEVYAGVYDLPQYVPPRRNYTSDQLIIYFPGQSIEN